MNEAIPTRAGFQLGTLLTQPKTRLLFTAAQAAGHGKDGTQALFTVVEKLASVH